MDWASLTSPHHSFSQYLEVIQQIFCEVHHRETEVRSGEVQKGRRISQRHQTHQVQSLGKNNLWAN